MYKDFYEIYKKNKELEAELAFYKHELKYESDMFSKNYFVLKRSFDDLLEKYINLQPNRTVSFSINHKLVDSKE